MTLDGGVVSGGVVALRYGARVYPYPMLRITNFDAIELSIERWFQEAGTDDLGRLKHRDLKTFLASQGVKVDPCGDGS